jgi:murein DD-endopeptidase MepM/ murein hydrolase activator NlpD
MVTLPNPFPASVQQGKPETTPQLGPNGLEQRSHNRAKRRNWALFSAAATAGLFVTQTASATGLKTGPQTQAAPVQPLVSQTVNTQIVIPTVPQTSLVITPRIAANAALPTPDTTVAVEAGDLDDDDSSPSVQVSLGASMLDWKCPVPGSKFTNDWGQSRSGGRSHTGTDMLAPRGTPVLAPFSGTALQKSSSRGGLSIYLKAPDGMQIFGAHLSSYGTVGKVKAGTIIGYVGNTGNASGAAPHLHLEIHPKKGAKTNPYPVLKKICG